MRVFETVEDYEKWLDEFEFLEKNTTLSAIDDAKLRFMRENTRNQRDVDEYEYDTRFRIWEKMCEKDLQKDNVGISLHDYAYEAMTKKMQEEKGLVKGK